MSMYAKKAKHVAIDLKYCCSSVSSRPSVSSVLLNGFSNPCRRPTHTKGST